MGYKYVVSHRSHNRIVTRYPFEIAHYSCVYIISNAPYSQINVLYFAIRTVR